MNPQKELQHAMHEGVIEQNPCPLPPPPSYPSLATRCRTHPDQLIIVMMSVPTSQKLLQRINISGSTES